MSWLLSFVFAGTVAHGPVAAPIESASLVHPGAVRSARELLASDSRRIRSSERRINKLLEDGVRRSRSFADLVSKIHRTNVIVYIETSHALEPETVGRILLQTVAGGQRYLRVQVRGLLQGDMVIAVIAHELHHALEVADDRVSRGRRDDDRVVQADRAHQSGHQGVRYRRREGRGLPRPRRTDRLSGPEPFPHCRARGPADSPSARGSRTAPSLPTAPPARPA